MEVIAINIKNILVIFTIVIGMPVLIESNYGIIKNLFSTEHRFIEASKKLEVKEERLSAINSLRKIVSKDEDYVPKVMEILCKYVQRRAPIPKDPGYDNTNPEADVQRALTVIGENNESFYKKGKKCHLSGTNLIRAKLIRANLTGADLERSNLSRADLTGADLKRADLVRSNLFGADLILVSNFDCPKLKKAKNWEKAYRSNYLECDADIPVKR